MKYSGLIFAFLSLFATALMAQDDESTIVTLNNRDFTVGEFKQVYFKNLDLVKQQEERSLDEYLDLLKVVMGGSTNKEQEKNKKNIVKKLGNELYLSNK